MGRMEWNGKKKRRELNTISRLFALAKCWPGPGQGWPWSWRWGCTTNGEDPGEFFLVGSTQLVSKWPTGYGGEFSSLSLFLCTTRSGIIMIFIMISVCAATDLASFFALCCVSLFCFVFFHILYCLNFWLRVFDSDSPSLSLPDCRLKLRLLPQPAWAFIIYANFFLPCTLLLFFGFWVPFECVEELQLKKKKTCK